MGAVYQAKDMKRQGALCAIKEMSLSMVRPEEQVQAIKNFKIEAKMLSVLGHPYLPAFTHFFAENQRYFLVMEYIEGATLEELLERNRGPFSEQRVLNWARQLCDVLEYLHSQNPPIIFRDMKPGNVMLTRRGHIKLIDFGIARFFRPTYETDGETLGTPGYSPREQYGTTQTDERSDIYALGMTLHHLLTNKFSETDFGVKAREIRAINPQVSVTVARALEKATALEPSDRYQSVADFRHALLGTRAFVFETGESASEPGSLAKLCARYPEEASEYLESGEISKWLRDIGEEGLSDIAWQIRTTESDPFLAVEQFLHAVLGPNIPVPSSPSQSGHNGNGQLASEWIDEDQGDDVYEDYQYYGSSQSGIRAPRYGTVIAVGPKTLDFGPVYPPHISAPSQITVDNPQGLWVRGRIQASDPWILLDRIRFDGPSVHVNVRIRSAQLKSYKAYNGEIIICPEGGVPVTITVSAEIQGYTLLDRRPGKTTSPEDDDEDDYEEVIPPTKSPQAVQAPHKPVVVPLDQDALTKYGPPTETVDGWDASMMNPEQQVRSRHGLMFTTACMASALWYVFLAQIVFLGVLPSDPGFVLLLAGMLLASPLGVMLVWRPHAWRHRETLERLITGASGALLVLGSANALLHIVISALGSPVDPMALLPLLGLTALGATYSTHPTVSRKIWSRLLTVSGQAKYIHWAIVLVAAISGPALGYLLTVSVTPGFFTGFGILVGVGVASAFISRLNHLLKFYRRP
jgi:serine/threonine protein kinase